MQKHPSLPASETSKFLFLVPPLFAWVMLSHSRNGVSTAAVLCKTWERAFFLLTFNMVQKKSDCVLLWKKKLVTWLQTVINPQMTSNKTFQ